MKSLAMDGDDTLNHDGQLVPLKIYIPDLLLQKNYHFHKEDLIWDIKEQIIDSLPKELKERFNYGLFCPPINGKAGKFLDEYRPLADYPLSESSGYLELRYKRRIYKMMNLEEKQIKQMHTRANLRRMLDYVHNGQVEKITKMCSRGMDPNFHCPETGETPLSLSGSLKSPAKVIMALVNGGALLDFRTKDGHTSLHRAVQKNNLESLKTLLDLGASPNYKDARGLTPLYYTLLHSSDPQLTEMLLHDHAFIGTCDPQGWQEVHQACKHGLVQHLEHLLFYGADMNARNASGNTPLHVCAVNDQENCARVLLFRGAEKNSLNYANQSPYQVAVIAGNLALADIIKNHSEDDVVPYRELPRYNPRRRASVVPTPAISRTHSDPRLELGLTMMMMAKPPSPCPSNCSLPPFSSISCISEASSTGSSTTTTTCTTHTSEDTDASFITEKSLTSDSSGVCTSHSGTSYEEHRVDDGRGHENGDHPGLFTPGTLCICTQDYCAGLPGHLRLIIGDSLEVIGETEEEGLLEGRAADGQEGCFPASVVQIADPNYLKPRVEGRRELNARKINTMPRRWQMFGEPRTVVLHKGKRGFGFVLRGAKATSPLMERQPSEFWPSLQYLDDVDKGGVADQAGLRKGDFLLEINGHDVSQASHELVVSIIRQSGDLVAMTVVTVQGQPAFEGSNALNNNTSIAMQRQCATLPRKFIGKKAAPTPPKRDPRTTLTVGRVRARSMLAGLAEIEALDRSLCDYDSEGRSTKSSSVESIPNKGMSHSLNDKSPKIASIRARPSSQRIPATELERFFQRQGSSRRPRSYSTLCERKSNGGTQQPKVYGSVAAMKRSKASRTKLVDIVSNIHKEFHSTPDLNNEVTDIDAVSTCEMDNKKKSMSQEDILNARNSRHSWAYTRSSYGGSLEILECKDANEAHYRDSWKSIENVYHSGVPTITKTDTSEIYAQTLPLKRSEKSHSRVSCPPPSHPPPPPPMGQVVQVDISKALGDYANVNVLNEDPDDSIMSSFRPGDSAKLYASPEVVMSVGYKSDAVPPPTTAKPVTQPRRAGGGSSCRSQSLPPKIPNGPAVIRSTTSSEAENSGDSSALYSTFKKPNRQRDSLSSDSGHVSDRGTLKSLKGKQSVTSGYTSKFDVEDSDPGSPQSYPPMRAPGHEPFIPEPDYETSEDDELPTSIDQGGVLTTFGKGEETSSALHSVAQTPSPTKSLSLSEISFNTQQADSAPQSPHTEAKRAIQEARERLRFSHKPADKNATVVFISGKITERKVEKSEIQLHRTEEGRLTGTVVISTSSEEAEPEYLTSPIIKADEKDSASRYPRRDAPASEYAKYRQQILSGLTRNIESLAMDDVELPIEQNKATSPTSTESPTKESHETNQMINAEDGLRIALTGAQKSLLNNSIINEMKTKEIPLEDVKETDVSLNVDPQNQPLALLPSCKLEENKAPIPVPPPAIQKSRSPDINLIREIEKSLKSQKLRFVERQNVKQESEQLDSNQRENLTPKSTHNLHSPKDKPTGVKLISSPKEDKVISEVKEILVPKTEKPVSSPKEEVKSVSTPKEEQKVRIPKEELPERSPQEKLARILTEEMLGQIPKPVRSPIEEKPIRVAKEERQRHSPNEERVVNIPKEVKPMYTPEVEKPLYTRKEEKPAYTLIEEKPAYTLIEEKPVYIRKDEKPAYTLIEEKPAYTRKEEKPTYTLIDEKPVYTRKEEKPAYTLIEEKPVYIRKEEKPVYAPKEEKLVYIQQEEKPIYISKEEKRVYIPNEKSAYIPREEALAYVSKEEKPIHVRKEERLVCFPKEGNLIVCTPKERKSTAETPHAQTSKRKEASIDVVEKVCMPTKHSRENRKTDPLSGKISLPSDAEKTLEESLDVLRLQVNSLGMAAVNEVDVFTQLVPPPPEFAAVSISDSGSIRKHAASLVTEPAAIPIAPPPEFSDVYPHRERRHTTGGRLLATSTTHRSSSGSSKSARHSGTPGDSKSSRISGNPVDLALLASLCAKSNAEFCRVGKRTDRCTVQPSRTMVSRQTRDSSGPPSQTKTVQKEFRFKLLQSWTTADIADWLDSLFLSEYKHRFAEAGITGAKLANMDSNDLMGLGVKQMGHRLNMERSLKRYLR